MSRPTLAETQNLFWKLITAPEGVASGLEDLEPSERRAADSLVRRRPPLSAVERLDVYANMYFFRLRDCVKQDFAAVAGVIGDVSFHNLMTDYLLAHPPDHFSLRYAGQHLPDFLEAHEVSQRWPYLADLARLEYAIVDAFDAADAEPLTADDLRGLPPEEWPQLRLHPRPPLRLLTLEWPVAAVWRAVKDANEIPPVAASTTRMRVWRRGWRVFHKEIDSNEAAALAMLAGGATFGEMCAAFGESEDEASVAAFGMLRAWLVEEVFTRTTREVLASVG